jgi:BirA family biotin operon repressor/biotin-[acetyl-CoA-carboxylase] ligase
MTDEQGSMQSRLAASAEQATREALAPFVSPERLEVVDSTNRYLVDLARGGAPEGTAVLARSQTAGRGRLGRRWLDPPAGGSVLCSVLFRPRAGSAVGAAESWHLLTWLVALAGCDACTDAGGVDVQAIEARLKWPNDIVIGAGLVGERKVAGLLAEVAVPPPADDPAVVVGIGINCNWPAGWPPADDPEGAAIAARATALDRVAGQPVDAEAVAARLLARVAARYGKLLADGPPAAAALASEYRRKSATIGRDIRVELAGETFGGRALDVDDGGRLLVDIGACVRLVEAGDVIHLR